MTSMGHSLVLCRVEKIQLGSGSGNLKKIGSGRFG